MPYEVEQKYRLTDRDAFLAKVTALGAIAGKTVTQVDTYYAHPVRDFAKTDEALRIRRIGDENFITYKGPKIGTKAKTRREIELPLAPGDGPAAGYAELLDALSFRHVAEVTKVRQTFHLERDNQTIELAVDQVENVGNFVELEIVVPTKDEIDAAQQKIESLASELQLTGATRESYLEMLLAE